MRSFAVRVRFWPLLIVTLLLQGLLVVSPAAAVVGPGTVTSSMDCSRGVTVSVMNETSQTFYWRYKLFANGTLTRDGVLEVKPGEGWADSTGLLLQAEIHSQTALQAFGPWSDDGWQVFTLQPQADCPLLAPAVVKRWGKYTSPQSRSRVAVKTTAVCTDVGVRRKGTKRINWQVYAMGAGKYRLVLPPLRRRITTYQVWSRNCADPADRNLQMVGSKRYRR